MGKPEELLDRVVDRDSFIAFVQALADEREEAEKIERADPKCYCVDGAKNWKNADITSYLYACLAYFGESAEKNPSWRMFADFLYVGKIYE